MASISSKEAFSKELTELEEQYKELTGEDMVKSFTGRRAIQQADCVGREMGWTFFWSLTICRLV